MHISEGVINGPLLFSGAVLSLGGTIVGLKNQNYEYISQTGVLTSAFFVGSLVHINIGPAGAHLTLNGLMGLLLGWSAFPAILVGLLLQSVFFQYGGITVLGVNTFNLAGPAVLCHYLFRSMMFKGKRLSTCAGFGAGFLAVLLSALMVSGSLIFSEPDLLELTYLMVASHLPIMIIEGVITVFCINFLKKVYPEILINMKGEQ